MKPLSSNWWFLHGARRGLSILLVLVVVGLIAKCRRINLPLRDARFLDKGVSFLPAEAVSRDVTGGRVRLFYSQGHWIAVFGKNGRMSLALSKGDGNPWRERTAPEGNDFIPDHYDCLTNKDGILGCVISDLDSLTAIWSGDLGNTWATSTVTQAVAESSSYIRHPSLAQSKDGEWAVLYTRNKDLAGASKRGFYFARSVMSGKAWKESLYLQALPSTIPPYTPSLHETGSGWTSLIDGVVYGTGGIDGDWAKRWSVVNHPEQEPQMRAPMTSDKRGAAYILWRRIRIQKDTTGVLGGGYKEGFVEICLARSENGRDAWRRSRIVPNQWPYRFVMSTLNEPTTQLLKRTQIDGRNVRLLDLVVDDEGRNLAVAWTLDGAEGGKLYVSASRDGGKSWSAMNLLFNEPGRYLFDAALAFGERGQLGALWSVHSPTPGKAFTFTTAGSLLHFASEN